MIRHLGENRRRLIVLTRGPSRETDGVRYVNWDAKTVGDWVRHLDGAEAIVNLVGRTVDCVKNAANRRAILDSRIDSVRVLGEAVRQAQSPPRVWVQSSTAHIYGDTADELLDESSPIGTGFAPEVGVAWENAFANIDLPRTRRVVLRTSFVIGRDGGAFGKMVPLTRLFLGGATGSGRHFMSWIHETDFCRIVMRAIEEQTMNDIYVVTAPDAVRNDEFMRLLRKQLRRPWSPRVPRPLVKIGAMLMRTDPELALFGRRCVPARLLAEGFEFRFPRLPEALADLLGATSSAPR